MDGKLNIGIVGCGNSASKIHCRQLLDAAEKIDVAACFDMEFSKAEEVGKLYNAKPYRELNEFLDHPGLEAVLVATKPPATHAKIGLQALDSGKHLLLEKPMCATRQEGEQLIKKAREKNRVLTVFQNRRGAEWDPDFEAMRWGVEQGYFGSLKIFETIWAGNVLNAEWLLDWGVHLFDQVLTMFKTMPVEVVCSAGPVGKGGVPVGPWAAFMRFAGGEIGMASMRIGVFGEYPRFSLFGENGGCAWPARSARIERPDENLLKCDIPAIQRGRDNEPLEPFSTEIGFTRFYDNFYDAVRHGAEVLVKPEEALMTVDVANAAVESSLTGKPISPVRG